MRAFLLPLIAWIWTVSLLAPTFLNLLDVDGDTIIVINLAEEEQKESEKKDAPEEKIIHQVLTANLTGTHTLITGYEDRNIRFGSDHIPEIHLPPPEIRT